MRSFLNFAGHCSTEFGIYVERAPDHVTAQRKVETVEIPGRNGLLTVDDGSYNNVECVYEIAFQEQSSPANSARDITAWLQRERGYQRLEDSYDPDVFRMALFVGPLEVTSYLRRFGRTKLKFNCKPQRFLKSGEEKLTFTDPATLQNPTAFPALPLIVVHGTGAGTVTIGNATVQIREIADQITLDCDLQDAYRQVGEGAPESKNSDIYALDFPQLLVGNNPVSWDGGVVKVEIIPRWWTL